MAKKKRQEDVSPKRAPGQRPKTPPADEKPSAGASEEEWRASEEQFVRGVLTRGEAARAKGGKLPPGATHEIVEEPKGKVPKLKRRRFSIS